jgi:hypothetical protein
MFSHKLFFHREIIMTSTAPPHRFSLRRLFLKRRARGPRLLRLEQGEPPLLGREQGEPLLLRREQGEPRLMRGARNMFSCFLRAAQSIVLHVLF